MAEKKDPALTEPKHSAVVWNDSQMKTTYANATNVVGAREEIQLILGVNKTWHAPQNGVQIDVTDRVVLSPYTAKRLAIMLNGTLKAYEAKYGNIELDVGKSRS